MGELYASCLLNNPKILIGETTSSYVCLQPWRLSLEDKWIENSAWLEEGGLG